MKSKDPSALLINFAERYVTCPCCGETEKCLKGCYYYKDHPDLHRTMQDARQAISYYRRLK